ncbi:hypothetical protein [Stenotrophomonas acidaminiphila]
MKQVNMFLQGPGGERRAVTLLATEQVPLETLVFHGPNTRPGVLVDLHILVDEHGNLARQIDHEGLRYRFSGSNASWVLVIS